MSCLCAHVVKRQLLKSVVSPELINNSPKIFKNFTSKGNPNNTFHLRINVLFFNLHDAMKAVGGAKIP